MKGLSKCLVLALCLLGAIGNISAQKGSNDKEDNESLSIFQQYFWWGANAGLQFSGGSFNGQAQSVFSVSVEPMLGYKIDKKGNFSIGPRIALEYLSFSNFQTNGRVNSFNFGGGIFSRAKVYREYFAHIEYEKINQTIAFTDGTTSREWMDNYFVGGGLSRGSNGAAFEVLILLNLNPESVSFNQSPVEYRVGFNVNF